MTMRQRQKLERVSIAAILLAFSAFFQITWLGANGPLLATAAATMNLLVAIGVVLLVPPDGRVIRRGWPILGLLGLALIWGVVSSSGTLPGREPPLTPDLIGSEISRFLGAVAILVAGACVGFRRGALSTSANAILLFGMLSLIIGLILRQVDPLQVWGFDKGRLGNRFTGTLLNANASGAVFGLLAVTAFGRWQALRNEPLLWRTGRSLVATCACALMLVVLLGACIITASRTVLVLTVLAMAVLLISGMPIRASGRALTSSRRNGGLALAGGAALVVLVAGGAVSARFGLLESDAVQRQEIWAHYWQMAQRSPWTGYGLGSFSEMNMRFLGGPADAVEFWYINAAHNILLQLLLEGGWPYLFLLLSAVTLIAVPIAKASLGGGRGSIFGSMCLGLLLIAGCAMVDIALDVPAIVTLCAAITGLLWGRSLRRATRHQDIVGRRPKTANLRASYSG